MRRRTFLQIFAAMPAVAMAQRAIPAVLGEPDVVRSREYGLWTVALDWDGRELCRAPARPATWTDYVYDCDDRVLLSNETYGVDSIFPMGAAKNYTITERFELRKNGYVLAVERFNWTFTTAQTLHVKWPVVAPE